MSVNMHSIDCFIHTKDKNSVYSKYNISLCKKKYGEGRYYPLFPFDVSRLHFKRAAMHDEMDE